MTPDADRWNHNIHYHSVVLAAVPGGCRSVLDVGCGEGMLTRALTARSRLAVGIDLHPPSLVAATAQSMDRDRYVRGDVLRPPFSPEAFDAVVSVAMLHHVDTEAALRSMVELLRPGGTLAIVGLARRRLPWDLPREVAGIVLGRAIRLTRGTWDHSAPTVWPPPLTYAETRAVVETVLPGAVFRRRLLLRYTIVWTKPS